MSLSKQKVKFNPESIFITLITITTVLITAVIVILVFFGESLLFLKGKYYPITIALVFLQIINIIPILAILYCGKIGFRYSVIYYTTMLLLTVLYSILFSTLFSISSVFVTISSATIVFVMQKFLRNIKKSKDELYKNANTDALTGLSNRYALINKLDKLIEQSLPFAVVFVDIDNFKTINDIGGHDDGDAVLTEITKRWSSIKDPAEYIARFGGDEFVLILNTTDFISLTNRIRDYNLILRDKITLALHTYNPSASFGVSLFPNDASTASKLLHYADTAMFFSRQNKDSTIAYFNSNMSYAIEEEAKIEDAIRYAIENDKLFAVYQPQYNLDNQSIRGFEALARMTDRDGNMISPRDFIPVAEKTGLVVAIDKIIMRKALTDFKEFAIKKRGKFLVAINISAAHLTSNSFLGDVWEIVNETGFPTDCLEIEITESLLISALYEAIDKLVELKKSGVKVALDDFGTGFASLNYLNKLPIDLIKIDKCFVDNIESQKNAASFLEAIITLGHSLNYSVISEGVETEEQLSILKDCHCDCIQGYVWGKPVERKIAVNIAKEIAEDIVNL